MKVESTSLHRHLIHEINAGDKRYNSLKTANKRNEGKQFEFHKHPEQRNGIGWNQPGKRCGFRGNAYSRDCFRLKFPQDFTIQRIPFSSEHRKAVNRQGWLREQYLEISLVEGMRGSTAIASVAAPSCYGYGFSWSDQQPCAASIVLIWERIILLGVQTAETHAPLPACFLSFASCQVFQGGPASSAVKIVVENSSWCQPFLRCYCNTNRKDEKVLAVPAIKINSSKIFPWQTRGTRDRERRSKWKCKLLSFQSPARVLVVTFVVFRDPREAN